MGSFGRALGFLAGGAAQGAGQGIVEEAKLNWQKMLHDESEARADAREGARRTYDAGEKAKDRTARGEEFKVETGLKEQEIKTRADETRATREETAAWRKQQAGETERYHTEAVAERRAARKDNYNLRLREIEGREANITTADMKIIEDAEKSLFGDGKNTFEDPEARAARIEEKAPDIVAALRKTKGRGTVLADYYAALHGVKEAPPAGAAPGLKGWSPLARNAPPKEQATAAPGAAPGMGSPAKQDSGGPAPDPDAMKQSALQSARDAIAKGANPDLVKERLRANGIDPSGL